MKVAIVDAYSTGNQICQRLSKKGVEAFHIQSSARIPDLLKRSFRKSDFGYNIIFDGNWEKLYEKVSEQSPTHILAGSETGVLLADQLSHAIGISGNDIELSQARRNKYLMLEAVKKSGQNSIWQVKENNLDSLLNRLPKNPFPAVVKPLGSTSGDGFHICYSNEDIANSYSNIIGKVNILGKKNVEVLCQPFIKGVEYVINSVSYEGVHYITDVWEMQHRHQKDIPMIIDSMTLLPPVHENWAVVTAYTKNILTAIGVRGGAAHTEVMLTKEGPFLIESNARLMGGNIDACFKEALGGYDQIDALVDSIVSPKTLDLRLKNNYQFNQCIAEIDFIFYESGILKKNLKEDAIRKLETFRKFSKLPEIGSLVNKTQDTTNQEGLLYLVHQDYEKIVRERDEVVSWQRNNSIFQIEEA